MNIIQENLKFTSKFYRLKLVDFDVDLYKKIADHKRNHNDYNLL